MEAKLSGSVKLGTSNGFDWVFENDVNLTSGSVWELGPDEVIKTDGISNSFNVFGTLRLITTPDHPVVFTTLNDNDHGYPISTTTPAPGNWEGIYVFSGGSAVLDNAIIRYGGNGSYTSSKYALVYVETGASLTLSNSTLEHSARSGVVVYEVEGLTLQNNIIQNCGSYGVYASNSSISITDSIIRNNANAGVYTSSSQATISHSWIYNNTNFGVRNVTSSITVIATNNWWGSPTGPFHATTNPDGEGNAVSDFVLFEPWLTYLGERNPVQLIIGEAIIGSLELIHYDDFFTPTQSGQILVVEITPFNAEDVFWVYSRFGVLPEYYAYDLRVKEKNAAGNYVLLIPHTKAGINYFSIYGRNVSSLGENYQISVFTVENYLSDVHPKSGGNAGEITLNITGLPFTDGMNIELRSASFPTIRASLVTLESGAELWVKFDLRGSPIGVYDLVAIWPDSTEARLAEAFTITAGMGPKLTIDLDVPDAVRSGREYVFTLTARNVGDSDLPQPILQVEATNASLRFMEKIVYEGTSLIFYLPGKYSAGQVISPGDEIHMQLFFLVNGFGSVEFDVSEVSLMTELSNNQTGIKENMSLLSVDRVHVHPDRNQFDNYLNNSELIKSQVFPVNNNLLIDNSRLVAHEMYFRDEVLMDINSKFSGINEFNNLSSNQSNALADIVWEASLVQDNCSDCEFDFSFDINPKLLIAIIYCIEINAQNTRDSILLDDLVKSDSISLLANNLANSFILNLNNLSLEEKNQAAGIAVEVVLNQMFSEEISENILDSNNNNSLKNIYYLLFNERLDLPLQRKDLEPENLPSFIKPIDTVIGWMFDHSKPFEADGIYNIFTGEDDLISVGYDGHRGYDYWPLTGNLSDRFLYSSIGGYLYNRKSERGNPGPTYYVEIVSDINNDGYRDLKIRYDHVTPEFLIGNLDDPPKIIEPNIPIAYAGNTGTESVHLHFEVARYHDDIPPDKTDGGLSAINLRDPFGWWANKTDPLNQDTDAPINWLWKTNAIVDDKDDSFQRFGRNQYNADWSYEDGGYNNRYWWTKTNFTKDDWALWVLKAPAEGIYNLQVYIPEPPLDQQSNQPKVLWTDSAEYQIIHKNIETGFIKYYTSRLDQSKDNNRWRNLTITNFVLKEGDLIMIILTDKNNTYDKGVVFDAVRLFGLSAQAINSSSIKLTWNDIGLLDNGIRIFMNSNPDPIVELNPEIKEYIVENLPCTPHSQFFIKSFDHTGESDSTNLVLQKPVDTGNCNEEFIIIKLIKKIISIFRPIDPNEKTGPLGAGIDQVIRKADPINYTVYFENLPTATAPAQEAFITDVLDPSLDWSTLRFTEVEFGGVLIPITTEDFIYTNRVTVPDYRDGVLRSWWVDIHAEFNPITGKVVWTYRTLDPKTGDLPEDVFAGFLPPEDGTGRGQGHVGFSIKPKANLADGTLITNHASIVFDTNEPIVTNQVWNTIGKVADLEVTLTGLPEALPVGQQITYTALISNNGPDPATNIIVTDSLPEELILISAIPSQGNCEISGSLSCNVGSLAQGESASIEIIGKAVVAGEITYTVQVVSDEADSNSENNQANEINTIYSVDISADLTISMSPSEDSVNVGTQYYFDITITNIGPDQAENVSITSQLPSQVGFISAVPSQGTCQTSNEISCDLGSIDTSGQATIRITVETLTAGIAMHIADVSSATFDPNILNNSATFEVAIISDAGFKIFLPLITK